MRSTVRSHRAWMSVILLALGSISAAGCNEAKPAAEPEEGESAGEQGAEGKAGGEKTASTGAENHPPATQGQDRADEIMARWKKENPGIDWEAEERKSRTFIPAADNTHLLVKEGTQAEGHPYRNVSERDLEEWKRETEKLVVAGSKIFHSADELGSTVAVSCDMCHPNAANTHPETYPKFQTQLGRVILLRDMINWCIQQPVRGKPLQADDPKMRALEAYIISQRAGTPLAYGKH